MNGTKAEAKVRERSGVAVIDLSGEIDGFAEEALAAGYAEATRGDTPAILFNFTAVDYINSTGIALIVGLLAQARKDGRTIMSCGLSDHYREIFEITRLADFMQVHGDEDSAVAELAGAEESQ